MNAQKQLSVAQRIENFLRRVGVPDPSPTEKFWPRLVKKHGDAAKLFGEGVRGRETKDIPIDAKNSSIDLYHTKDSTETLSLDIAGQYDSKFYRDFVVWLLSEVREEPTAILDIGCGNGVLTCLIAHMWPSSKVIGVDVRDPGLDIARNISKRMGLGNVDFLSADYRNMFDKMTDKSFDLILASKAFHYILEVPDHASLCAHSVQELYPLPLSIGNTNDLERLRQRLMPKGLLISTDRWKDSGSFIWWIRSAEAAGFRVSLDRSCMLSTKENTEAEEFPVTVFAGKDSYAVPSDEHLIAFLAYPKVKKYCDTIGAMEGAYAEALYISVGNRETIGSFVATYRDGSGTFKLELFVAGALAGRYATSSLGYRQLFLASAAAIGSLFQDFMKEAARLEKTCDIVHGDHDCENTLSQFGLEVTVTRE